MWCNKKYYRLGSYNNEINASIANDLGIICLNRKPFYLNHQEKIIEYKNILNNNNITPLNISKNIKDIIKMASNYSEN